MTQDWLFLRDVFLLTGVSFDVVEFLAVDEPVLRWTSRRTIAPFDGIDDALGIGDEEAVGPLHSSRRDRGGSKSEETIEFDAAGVGDFAGVEQGGDDIDGVAEGVDLPGVG